MQLDRLQAELRPRSAWEAMELGTALVRRNAGVVWRAWLLASLPVFVLCNALAWALDMLWLAALVMWWLKPAFDRVPLFVLSRSVFAHPVGVREGAWAAWRLGRGALLRDLTWGRISFRRALVLPVSLLEGATGKTLRERRRVLAGQGGETVVWLTLLCLHFEALLVAAVIALVPLFVPVEFLSESARAVWSLVFEAPPRWAQLLVNLATWGATSLVEPFYVGAGFGLYLNRRTQLEGWDIEIAFRRMRQRLRAGAATLMVALLCVAPLAVRAQDAGPQEKATDAGARSATRTSVFADAAADPRRFQDAVERAYRDPLLHPVRKQTTWVPKVKPRERDPGTPWSLRWLDALTGGLAELVLWGLLVLAALWLLWKLPQWWPGLLSPAPREARAPPPVHESEAPHQDALPHDIAAAARRLWSEGKPRAALALLYRASVEAMAKRIDATLPPGATEAQCLRASRRLPDADDRSAFADIVRTWQHAAYAQRLPDADAFERLLARGGQRFGWSA